MSWIQGMYTSLHSKKQKHELDFLFDGKVPLSGSSGVSSEYRTEEWKMLLSFLMTRSQLYTCLGVGRTEFSLANVFESLRHIAPNKPSAVLLASCTRVWLDYMYFGSLFLSFTVYGFLGGNFWVNCQLPDSVLKSLL